MHPSQSLSISHTAGILRNGQLLHPPGTLTAIDFYRHFGFSYLKFFKMDALCQWAWLGAELLLQEAGNTADKNKTAVVLATTHGSLSVDKRFLESMEEIASPALFVYTLPNIMLGEISIRHGFKGEQLCLVQNEFDRAGMEAIMDDLLRHRGMDAALYGYVDELEGVPDVQLWWADTTIAP